MPSITQILTILVAGRRGMDVYHSTGDTRAAVRAGTDLAGAIWLISAGLMLTVVVGFLGIFWLPLLGGLVITVSMVVAGIIALCRVNARARATLSPVAPPPIPGRYIER